MENASKNLVNNIENMNNENKCETKKINISNKIKTKKSIKKWFKEKFFTKKEDEFKPEYKDILLKVNNLTKQYKPTMAPAIQGLNFEVGKGEFHAFIGGNGAGKTTTIKSIVGAYAKFKGEIYLSGWSNKTTNAKKHLGYIPEVARFPDGMSTETYLMQMCLLAGLSTKEAKNFVKENLELTHMSNLAKKSPNTFSSGQKKKILLLQALVHNPDLIIMDEPAANLDPTARIEFFDTLQKLQAQGKSIFISSHILSEVEKYADHATILDGGKIVFTGSLKNMLESSSNVYNVISSDEQFLIDFLKHHNLSFKTFAKGRQIVYQIEIYNHELAKSLADTLLKNNKLIMFEKYKPTLDDLYKEFVIRGSVHTMENK